MQVNDAKATSRQDSQDLDEVLDSVDQGAKDAFEKGHQAAKQAQIYTCGGPRLSGGMVLDVRSAEQKLRDERWEKATKK